MSQAVKDKLASIDSEIDELQKTIRMNLAMQAAYKQVYGTIATPEYDTLIVAHSRTVEMLTRVQNYRKHYLTTFF